MNTLFYDSLFSLGKLLHHIVRLDERTSVESCVHLFLHCCSTLGWQLYAEHYERDFPLLFRNPSQPSSIHLQHSIDHLIMIISLSFFSCTPAKW